MKNAYRKNFIREITGSPGRFLSILAIVFLGAAFFSGIRATEPDMRATVDTYFKKQHCSDIRVTSSLGLNEDDLAAIRRVKSVRTVEAGYEVHVLSDIDGAERAIDVLSIPKKLNRMRVKKGRLPKKSGECVIDEKLANENGFSIGSTVTLRSGSDTELDEMLKTDHFRVCGIVNYPAYLSDERGSTIIGDGTLYAFIGILGQDFALENPTTASLVLSGTNGAGTYDDAYQKTVDRVERRLKKTGALRSEARKSEMLADIAKQEKKVADRESDVQEGEQKLADGEQQLRSARQQAANGRRQIASAEKQLDDSEKSLASQETQLEEGLAQVRSSEASLREGIAQTEAALENAETEEERAALEAKKAELENQLSGLEAKEAELTAQQKQIESGKAQIASSRRTIAARKAQLDSAEAKIRTNQAELEKQKQSIADAKTQLQSAKKRLTDARETVENLDAAWTISDRSDNSVITEYGDNAEKIGKLANVFPVLFFLIAALVSLTAMTRTVDREREEIGTFLALGYPRRAVMKKYTGYCVLATASGSIAGALIGEKLLPGIIITAYGTMYKYIEGVATPYDFSGLALATAAALALNLTATAAACGSTTRSVPASLMRPRAPKNGSSIFLERIPAFWKRLSFSRKATLRNLFRYKKRMLMTVLGIGGCTALLLVGFGIRDSVRTMVQDQYDRITTYDVQIAVKTGSSRSTEEAAELDRVLADDKNVRDDFPAYAETIRVSTSSRHRDATLIVPEDPASIRTVFHLQDRKTGKRYRLDDRGIIVTEKLAKVLGVSAGSRILLKMDEKTVRVRVRHVTENYLGHTIYMSPALYQKLTGGSPAWNVRFVRLKNNSDRAEKELTKKVLALEGVRGTSLTSGLRTMLDETLDMLQLVILILMIAACMLAFVVIFNLNIIAITERKRELATLKVLGFYDGEVAMYVYRENIFLTLFGIIVGLVLGFGLHRYIMTTVETDVIMFGRIIEPSSYILSAAFTALFAVAVNAVTFFSLRRIDMIESLKSVE